MRSLHSLAALALLALGCQGPAGPADSPPPSQINDHWSMNSIAPRMGRVFLGYNSDRNGRYIDYQWEKKRDINLTLSRHLLSWNPKNPFEPEAGGWLYGPRPTHSLLPKFWTYIHVEGLVWGAIIFGLSGAFIPLPIDSLIATFSKGGDYEFMQGVGETVQPAGVLAVTFVNYIAGEPSAFNAVLVGLGGGDEPVPTQSGNPPPTTIERRDSYYRNP